MRQLATAQAGDQRPIRETHFLEQRLAATFLLFLGGRRRENPRGQGETQEKNVSSSPVHSSALSPGTGDRTNDTQRSSRKATAPESNEGRRATGNDSKGRNKCVLMKVGRGGEGGGREFEMKQQDRLKNEWPKIGMADWLDAS